jgi:preprotein translocase subunit SecD
MNRHALPALAAFALLLCCLAPAAAQAQRAGQSRGLWIGTIPACAGTVAMVSVEPDQDFEGELNAVISFRPAWRAALLRETTRLVGRPMPVRLDGRILIAPVVREPIAGGMVSLSPASALQGERIRAATRRPCPRARR